VCDPDTARRRHARARLEAGVRGRPLPDGMGRITVDLPAVDMVTALAALKGRAAAMAFDGELTQGQREVAAFCHAVGCERVQVQATLECPVEQAVDVQALAGAAVWTVDVRLPVAVALGLSDHPGVLTGYGPIGADEARALLPSADLVKACVDSGTGEVLAVGRPVPRRTWSRGDPDRARALRRELLAMATTPEVREDLTTDGYVPSAALGRLVDLRDVTSVFPGDLTPTRRTDRDHRLPYPLGRTDEDNLQNAGRRWHRAKHSGWRTKVLQDGTVRWTSPGGRSYDRPPRRTPPPALEPGRRLPPLT
jgi:hypothetical protein